MSRNTFPHSGLAPRRIFCSPLSGNFSTIGPLNDTAVTLGRVSFFSKLKGRLTVNSFFFNDDEVQDAAMARLREQAADFYDAGT